jgi:uncharacterized hydrophobic protein (TIGR00271 family)
MENQNSFLYKVAHYFNLDSELEHPDKIHATIEKDVLFKGTNLWILVFAIIVASVGLNMNSTAVIIGAMLISPLMGPINGIGYSLATYNFELFRKAVKNLSFAVGASLVASTLYFAISPVSTAHSELLARTSPTIYDVLIAFFGGLSGILAISSRHKGNVIPGVAIAPALMPPLCTAGYGLATGQFTFFFGAFYLFTINTVFIAFAGLAMSQLLKYPIRTLVKESDKKKVNRWISFIIFITVIPSIYFGYGLVQKEHFSHNAARFSQSVNVFEGNYLLSHLVDADKRLLTLVYAGNELSENQQNQIKNRATLFSLQPNNIVIEQGLSFGDWAGKLTETDQLKTEIARLNKVIADKEVAMKETLIRNQLGQQLLSEGAIAFPDLTSCVCVDTKIFTIDNEAPREKTLVVFSSNKPLSENNQQQIRSWVEARLGQPNTVMVYFSVD